MSTFPRYLTPIQPTLVKLLPAMAIILSGCSQPPTAGTVDTAPSPYTDGLSADQLSAECDRNLKQTRNRLSELEQLSPPYTADSVLKPIDRLLNSINNDTGMVFLLNNAHPDASVQEAADSCVQQFMQLQTDIGLSPALYQRVAQTVVDNADPQTRRVRQRLLRDFDRFGVGLAAEKRETVREINKRIIELGQDFSKNIRSDVRQITVPAGQALAGLPQDYIDDHPVDSDGNIAISTDYPDLFPFMRYAHNDAARKDLYIQYLNRAWPINDAVLGEIIEQRYRLARALDYPDFASYATEIMMVKSPETVSGFIDRVNELATPRAQRDYAALLDVVQSDYPNATQVDSWRKFYAEERVRKRDYQVDTKAVREYFQFGNVKQGIFDLVQDLFGVEIVPWSTAVWHPSVETYAIRENGNVLGYFYLDLHPRQQKYKHAAQFDVQAGIVGEQLPIAALVCNFPGENDPSALMEHGQVETFLHEFGHLLHHIFSGRQQWALFSGVATERDFVEAPSQMLEEWIWDYDTLKRFAVNRQGEVIPEALVQKMRKARDFARGTHIRNQMFYAALSLDYYMRDPAMLDLEKTLVELQQQYSPFPYVENTHFYASFGHLYGYSAAYYTYMWSEVIAADILQQFKQQGMRNRELAIHYRKTILEPGGSKDAEQLVEDFLGRPFSFDAFANRLNQK